MFEQNKIYKRSYIHDQYGGSRQNGISPSAKHPFIFVFSGASGDEYGYKDRWENNDVFSYTGEGQVGDMQFIRGNLRLRDHLQSGKRVFLFQYVKKAYVEYVDEMTIIDFDYFQTHDRNGDSRIGIKFFLKRLGSKIYDIPNDLSRLANEPEYSDDITEPNNTERKGLTTSRVGQGAYRKSILHRWQYKCAVTQFNNPKILIASHIVPWKDSTDNERLDVDNGILLSPDFDALFDQHLISFEDSGKIILSSRMEHSNYSTIGITGKEKIKNLSSGNKLYLNKHRDQLG